MFGSSRLAAGVLAAAFVGVPVVGCMAAPEPETGDETSAQEAELTSAQRKARADLIKVVAAERGISNALLIAGVAWQESSGLDHCQSEHGGCGGPASADCGGGAVMAGNYDGACNLGGLGMFQLDLYPGDHQAAIQYYADHFGFWGKDLLSLKGNIRAGVAHILEDIWVSTNTPPMADEQAELAWINGVRPGTPDFEEWLTAITHHFNGCWEGWACGFSATREAYRASTAAALNAFGWDYWYGASPAPAPAPSGGSCSCSNGADYKGNKIPASSTYCGFRVCGGDHALYECGSVGWGKVAGAPACGYASCQCANGMDYEGHAIPVGLTHCGYRICGKDHQFYDCGANGWGSTGLSCGQ